MAKRYRGYKSLNKMITELENTVISVSIHTGEVITPTIVTKKSPAHRFSQVIDIKTGKFLSYNEAKQKFYSDPKSHGDFTYKDYLNKMHEFQDTGLAKQLTISGEREYHYERGRAIFGDEMFNDIIDKIGYANYREAIDTIGRMSNDLKKENSNYDSNTFYDIFSIFIENIEEGTDINTALDMLSGIF